MLLAVMGSDDATEILDRLAARGIEVWVDGGSGATPCSRRKLAAPKSPRLCPPGGGLLPARGFAGQGCR
jgi:hypothetical protein